MSAPERIAPERIALAPDYEISRVVRGGWQLAGGHGAIDPARAVEDLLAAYDAGITTFDCADIYTGVEALYGAFRRALADRRGAQALSRIRIHTKLVPDLSKLGSLRKSDVAAIVARSASRLGMERLDLVQFHWWDLAVPGWLEVFGWLAELAREGAIDRIGGTNFDSAHAAAAVQAGVPLFSLQVQASVLDRRAERSLVPLARAHGIALLAYGTVAGGFLGERWLGAPEPEHPLENRSLTKYKLIVDDGGGWGHFQAVLGVLKDVADRHGTDIASIASRCVLDRPGLAAVIVGARDRTHLARNAGLTAIALTERDRAAIAAVLAEGRPLAGDVYELERDRHGRHGSIMKYELNTAV